MATRGVAMTVTYVAWDTSANEGKTGDAANHTLRWVKDGTAAAPTNAASEVDGTNAPGVYKVTLTATETDCDLGTLAGKSSTSGVSLIPVQLQFERLPDAAPGAAGGVLISGTNAGTTTLGRLVVSDGLSVARATLNGHAVEFTGNGAGVGFLVTGGASGRGFMVQGYGGAGLYVIGTGDNVHAFHLVSGQNADAFRLEGGATAGVGLRVSGATHVVANLPWNAAWDAEVQSEVVDALTAEGYTSTRAGYLDKLNVSGTLAHSDAAATYQADVSALATAANLAVVAGYLDTEMAAVKAVTDKLDDTLEDDGGVYRFTANALEQAPSGGGTDWTADERTAIRAILGVPASGTTPDDPAAGILDTIRDLVVTVDGVADAVLADTGTTIPGLIAGLNNVSAADVWAAADRQLTAFGFTVAPTAEQVADAVLARDVDNVEATAPEHSLATILLATLESSIAGTTWTIRRSDGVTTHVTKTVTKDAAAEPITGVA